ncbi:MAG: DUF5665 domain-containing protein [bacterium]|nr:DUF5665 domain-containing protein [bacterium]
MPRSHKLLHDFQKSLEKKSKHTSIFDLAHEVHRVADVLERQNLLSRRFFMGLVLGLGTALGASIIATLAIFVLRVFINEYLGIDISTL